MSRREASPQTMDKRRELAALPDTLKRIHVDQRIIKSNTKNGLNDPPITIQTSAGSLKAHGVIIHGPSLLVNRPHDPLSCGARVWIETLASLTY